MRRSGYGDLCGFNPVLPADRISCGLMLYYFWGKAVAWAFPQYINDNLKQKTALEVTETRKDGEQNGGRIWLT